MNMNLTRIAKLAGVSVSTVSKAFSGSAEISEKTRQRIFEVAKEQGLYDKYNKNKFGKKVIGVICPEITSDYYNMFASILNRKIVERGGLMTLSVGNFDPAREAELFTYYSSYCGVDGVILINPSGEIKNPFHFPAVSILPAKASENVDTVQIDFAAAIGSAIGYLKEKGHTRVAFAGETLTAAKQALFESAMRKAGLPLRAAWIKNSSKRFEEAGEEMMRGWLIEGPLPTAILAAYDYIAIGIIKVLREHGLRVPEDISVIGMDDIAMAPYLDTSLSSIRTYTEEACGQTVDLITKKFENPYYHAHREIRIAAEFIPRSSVGSARSRSASCAEEPQ